MGTSSSFGGAGSGTPLVPSWLQDAGGAAGTAGGAPVDGGGDGAGGAQPTPQPGSPPAAAPGAGAPPAPAPRPVTPVAGPSARFTAARTAFSKFASSGGSDRRNLGRAVSQYVSTASGGAGRAAQRMGSSQRVGAGLINFLNTAATAGVQQALRSLNLDSLAGRSVEEVFAGLADYICPEGGGIDEGIARDAFIETIADLAGAGITDFDGLTAGRIQTVFELYASHAIEARICNDIGTKLVTLPANSRAAESVQAQLHDFIQRGVSDAVARSGVDIQALTPDTVTRLVGDVYRSGFEILKAMGDAEAAR